MAQKLYASILESWEVPQCPFRIEYDPEVLEEIRRLAVNGFHSLPHGGAEIGGILFGTYQYEKLQIRALWPMKCQYLYGPSFVLSDADFEEVTAILETSRRHPRLEGLVAAGWYHSHTRSDIFLSDKDLEIHERFFEKFWQIALVVRPNTLEPTRAGFFFREQGGQIRSDRSYEEIILRPLRRRAEIPSPEAEPAVEAADKLPPPERAPLAVELREEPTSVMPLPDALPEPNPAAPVRSKSAKLPWIIAAAAGALLIAVVANTRPPIPVPSVPAIPLPPALHLTAGETDGQLLIRWDRTAMPVRTAKSGMLEVQDGGSTVTAPLPKDHLVNGTFTYERSSARVHVRLTLDEPDGTRVQESTGFYGKAEEHGPTSQEQNLQDQVEQLKTQLQQEKRLAEELKREVAIQRNLLKRK